MEVVAEPHATVLVLASRKSGMTFDEFKSYYENNHVPLVTRLVLQGDNRPILYNRQYIERDHSGDEQAASFPFGGVENWDYDCVTRVVFRDRKHRDSCFAVFGEHRAEIAADEEKFLDTSKLKIIFVAQEVSSVRKE